MMRNWDRRVWVGLGLVGLMGVAIFFGFRQDPHSFDDAYITYRYARNIALGRGFVYNVGEPVLGTTTPLYALLLAGLSFIWPDLPLLSHSISILAWMLSVAVMYGIGRAAGRETVGMAAAALVALNALFLGVLGMETTLYLLLVLSTFYFCLEERPIWAAVCAGLTFLTRWDGILVVGVFLLAEMLKRRGTFLRASLVCATITVPWLVYSDITFGSIFPNTFFAKLGQGWNRGLGGSEIGSFGQGLLLTATSAYTDSPLFLLLLMFATLGLWSALHRKARWWPLLLWTIAYIGGYVALGVLRFPWYYPPLVPAFALLTAEGIEMVAQFISLRLKWSRGQVALVAALGALCLAPNVHWLINTQRTRMDAHSVTYLEVGSWLQTHTPANSSVALIEIGIIGFYSDRTIVDTMGLVSPEMTRHLGNWLQTLQFAVNYYWPDYVVGLERTAWTGVIHEPWFEEAYVLVTQIENGSDPVAPVSIYRRRSGFPPHDFVLNSAPNVQFDPGFVLRQIGVAEDHIRPGEMLHVQLTWEAQADIHTDYQLQFDLLKLSDGRRWTLASGLQPMRGGNPTTQWHSGDSIVDAHTLTVPADVPSDSYLLQLIVTGKGGPVAISEPTGKPIGHILAGPLQVGRGLKAVREPSYPVAATFANNISLAGYDLDGTSAPDTLSLTLYWKATDEVSRDYTVFVHFVSPEGDLIAQHDSPPLLPTSFWIPGVQVTDVHTLSVPVRLSPGNYQVRIGLYQWPDLERAPITASGCLDAASDALLLAYVSPDSSQARGESTCADTRWIVR